MAWNGSKKLELSWVLPFFWVAIIGLGIHLIRLRPEDKGSIIANATRPSLLRADNPSISDGSAASVQISLKSPISGRHFLTKSTVTRIDFLWEGQRIPTGWWYLDIQRVGPGAKLVSIPLPTEVTAYRVELPVGSYKWRIRSHVATSPETEFWIESQNAQ